MSEELNRLFRHTRDTGGSDLHLTTGLRPRVRVAGRLEPVHDSAEQSDAEIRELLRTIVDESQWEQFLDSGDLDFAHSLEGVARFRVNYLQEHRGIGAVFRLIPEEIRPLEELGAPDSVAGLAELRSGLVLVTGPTGSGKSTTLAAIVDRINTTSAKHIITIEEPIEFIHHNDQSVISQREIGTDTSGFGGALRTAIRQDADVILVGEMRDLSTISLAIRAAEMGSVVFGTLHTNGAANAVDRMIDAFPAEEQERIRATLAESLGAVVSQLLIPTADGSGRVAAFEVLLRTSSLPNLIREGNSAMMRSLMQGGKSKGMQTMDEALQRLVDDGTIHPREAYLRASDKSRFEEQVSEESISEAEIR